MLAHDRWFSLDSSITKTGRHDIAEILLKVALNNKNQIKSNSTCVNKTSLTRPPFLKFYLSACTKSRKWAVMYICVRDVKFAFSTTFLFEFRTVPTVWYFFYWAMFIYLLTTRLLIYTDVICRWHCFIVYKSYPVTSNWNKSNSLLSRTGINRILLSRTCISRIPCYLKWYKSNPVISNWYKSNPGCWLDLV